MPPDLVESLAIEEKVFNSARSRQASWTYLSLFVLWAAIPFMQVKSWPALVGFYALLGLGAAVSWRNSTRGYSSILVTLVITGLVDVVFTRITGPFILTPIVICAVLMQLAAIRQIAERLWLVVTWVLIAVMLPLVLEWTGVLHQSYAVTAGVVIASSDTFEMNRPIDEGILVATNLLFIVSAGVGRSRLSASPITAMPQKTIKPAAHKCPVTA